jgi:hypothetical protein
MKLIEASVLDLLKAATELPAGSSVELKIDNKPYPTKPHLWVWIGSTCRAGRVELDDSLDNLPAFIEAQDKARTLADARRTLEAAGCAVFAPGELQTGEAAALGVKP